MKQNTTGKLIQKYREQAGLSQEQLAEAIERSPIFISYMERDVKRPSLETIKRLARVLDISIDILLGNDISKALTPRLLHIESLLKQLPAKSQMRVLDILEEIITVEMRYKE